MDSTYYLTCNKFLAKKKRRRLFFGVGSLLGLRVIDVGSPHFFADFGVGGDEYVVVTSGYFAESLDDAFC